MVQVDGICDSCARVASQERFSAHVGALRAVRRSIFVWLCCKDA